MDMRAWPGRTHRFVQVPVLYPFGHGLSYNSYSYSNLLVNSNSLGHQQPSLQASVRVKNDGEPWLSILSLQSVIYGPVYLANIWTDTVYDHSKLAIKQCVNQEWCPWSCLNIWIIWCFSLVSTAEVIMEICDHFSFLEYNDLMVFQSLEISIATPHSCSHCC